MVRFKVNRSWAFVLALGLFTICFFVFAPHSPAIAGVGPSDFVVGGDQPGGSSPLTGDPDVPAGPGDGKAPKLGLVRGGAAAQVVTSNGVLPLGEARVQTGVAMDRVRLFLLGIRGLWLHF